MTDEKVHVKSNHELKNKLRDIYEFKLNLNARYSLTLFSEVLKILSCTSYQNNHGYKIQLI